MTRFLASRLLLALATLLALSLITFLLGALAPGDPVRLKLGERANPEQVQEVRRRWGLDRPLPERYLRWLGGLLRGDLGISYRDSEPVSRTLVQRYPVTAQLAGMAALFALAAGVPLGLTAAARQGTWVDRLATLTALTGVSIPSFVLLPLLVLFFSLRLRWFPVTYEREWWHLVLPALALGARPAALLARMTRTAFVDALSQDYVRTARAKGLSWMQTLLRHAAKNAVIPVLTVFGTSVGYLLGGSFVVETLFGIPGVGEISISSVSNRDYPMIQAVTMLAAAVFISVNLVVDLLYGLLDPRLRVGRARA